MRRVGARQQQGSGVRQPRTKARSTQRRSPRPHVAAERRRVASRHFGPGGADFTAPFGVDVREVSWDARRRPIGFCSTCGDNPAGRGLATAFMQKLPPIQPPNTWNLSNPSMIHQRQVIGGVGVPAVISLYVCPSTVRRCADPSRSPLIPAAGSATVQSTQGLAVRRRDRCAACPCASAGRRARTAAPGSRHRGCSSPALHPAVWARAFESPPSRRGVSGSRIIAAQRRTRSQHASATRLARSAGVSAALARRAVRRGSPHVNAPMATGPKASTRSRFPSISCMPSAEQQAWAEGLRLSQLPL